MESHKYVTLALIAAALLGVPLVCMMINGCPTAATSENARPDRKTVFFDDMPDTQPVE